VAVVPIAFRQTKFDVWFYQDELDGKSLIELSAVDPESSVVGLRNKNISIVRDIFFLSVPIHNHVWIV